MANLDRIDRRLLAQLQDEGRITNVERTQDATHGFSIGGYNINLSLEPGETQTNDTPQRESSSTSSRPQRVLSRVVGVPFVTDAANPTNAPAFARARPASADLSR